LTHEDTKTTFVCDVFVWALKSLKEISPNLLQTVSQRWLLSWDGKKKVLDLVDFDEIQAVEWLKAGRVMILLRFEKVAFLRSVKDAIAIYRSKL
jgi:hypothetical protein